MPWYREVDETQNEHFWHVHGYHSYSLLAPAVPTSKTRVTLKPSPQEGAVLGVDTCRENVPSFAETTIGWYDQLLRLHIEVKKLYIKRAYVKPHDHPLPQVT